MADTTWILVANASHAKLYATHNLGNELIPIVEFTHPESRTKGIDLVSDRVGHYHAMNGSGYGSFVETSDPKSNETARFAAEIASMLDQARTHNAFDRLIWIMPAQFDGVLKSCCNSQVVKKVVHTEHKNCMNLNERELNKRLIEFPRY